ncbi:hypothetical protein ACLOAV_008504 [Pseudogymnoascus australis]
MAAEQSPQYEVVLFGATGYTGQLCAEHIHANLPSDLRWAISGRSQAKLESLRDELESKDSSRALPAIEVCGLEADQLQRLARKAKVIIATVGPYQDFGEPMLAACAKNGTHYLDCTGETPWILEMIEKYHETAQKTGAILIPSCGFDSVPADISTFAVVDYIRTKFSSPTARVDFSVHEVKGGISGGTMNSLIRGFEQYSLSSLTKSFAPFSLAPRRPNRSLPPPTPSLASRIFGLRKIPGLGWLGANPQGFVDRCYVNRSWGLAADNDVGGDGPALSFREKCMFVTRTSAVADSTEGQQVIGNMKVNVDPYTFTGICMGEAALLLARDTGIQDRLKGGILTASMLGRTFLEGLERNGTEMEIKEVV